MNITPRFPFEIDCLVYRRPHLRDDNLEMEMYMGKGVLESIYDKLEQRPDVKTLFLSFPERWLNIIEERQLYERLQYYCPNLQKVTIKTHSVYIVQCTTGKDIGLIDEIPQNENQTDVTCRQWVSNRGNLIDMSKLNVL